MQAHAAKPEQTDKAISNKMTLECSDSFSSHSHSSLDFSLSLGDSSANHLAPNETPLSLRVVIGSVSRWWLAGSDVGGVGSNLPIDPSPDQTPPGQSMQHLPQLHTAMYSVKVMVHRGLLLTCGG